MSGWARLYAVAVFTCLSGAATLIYIDSPEPNGPWAATGCEHPIEATRTSAKDALTRQSWRQAEYSGQSCEAALNSIASGERKSLEGDQWVKRSQATLGITSAFLLLLFVAGMAAGWVWRGFFPPKK